MTITLQDLEVFYHVGVSDEERRTAQRLLLTIQLDHDFSTAARTDNLADTIDYFRLSRRLLQFGEGRSWHLIEKLAADIADMILADFAPHSVLVEVKKFVLPEARHVSVTLRRPAVQI
jgi:7,8-dihydroneopterin aldolase/epimerase/oxygenase